MSIGPATPLGIIAGRGALPRLIAQARADAGLPYIVVGLEGFVEDWIAQHPHRLAPITSVGRILRALAHADCTHVTMAGGVDRPAFNPLKLDVKTLSWLPKVLPAMRRGDDALLRTVRQLLEAEGLTLIGADSVLPLTSADAIPTRAQTTATDISDVQRAENVLSTLSPLDVGQGAVVAEGMVLGIETIQGTDAMLNFVAHNRRGQGGVLVKRLKIGQDRDLDMPAIGPETMRRAAQAGLNGVAIEANGVLILGQDETIAVADSVGLFLWIKS